MRLPNVKILLCWSSRTQIYGFVENHTFLEQFVRMGVPAQFVRMGVPAQFSNLGVPAQFSNLGVPAQFTKVHVFLYNFLDYTVTLAPYIHDYDTVQIDGVNARHRAKADSLRLSVANRAKGELRAKTGMGVHPNVSMGGPKSIKREPTVRD